MMKKYKLLLILQILLFKAYSQDTFDDVKLSVCGNTPKIFYEGQCLYLTFCIENLSNHVKQYHKRPTVWIEDFRSKSGEEVEHQGWKKRGVNEYKSGIMLNVANSNLEKMHPDYKYLGAMDLTSWGNVNFTNILNIPDSTYDWPSSFAVLPQFLKPGEYTIKLEARLLNTNNRIKTHYAFQVLKAEGETQHQLFAYLNAFKNDLNTRVEGSKLTKEPQLVTFLKNYPQSIYAMEVFRLLTIEYGYMPPNADIYIKDSKNMFFLFELLPSLTKYQSEATVQSFLSAFTAEIGTFERKGIISSARNYIDTYLKRIQHLSPFVSAIMIEVAEYNLNILGLKNYAQEREDLERAKSNSKG